MLGHASKRRQAEVHTCSMQIAIGLLGWPRSTCLAESLPNHIPAETHQLPDLHSNNHAAAKGRKPLLVLLNAWVDGLLTVCDASSTAAAGQ